MIMGFPYQDPRYPGPSGFSCVHGLAVLSQLSNAEKNQEKRNIKETSGTRVYPRFP